MRQSDTKANYSPASLQPSPDLYNDVTDKEFPLGFSNHNLQAPHEFGVTTPIEGFSKSRLEQPNGGHRQKSYPKAYVATAAPDKALYKDVPVFQHLDDAFEKGYVKPDFDPPILHSNDPRLLAASQSYDYAPSFDRHEQLLSSFPLHSPYTGKAAYTLPPGGDSALPYQSGSMGQIPNPIEPVPDSTDQLSGQMPQISAHAGISGYSAFPIMQPDLSALQGMISGQEAFSGNMDNQAVVLPDQASRPASVSTPVPASTPNARKRPRVESADSDLSLVGVAEQISASSLDDVVEKVKLIDAGGQRPPNDSVWDALASLKSGKSDKHHQALALSWMQKSCKASRAAVVPRNRFYARYAQMCASHNMNPLLSGLFFRLVRMLFPNIKTRRLGSRGRSKYHFCGVKLLGEVSVPGSPVSTYSSVGMDSPQSISYNTPTRVGSPMVNRMLQTPVSSTQMTDRFVVNELAYLPHIHLMMEQSIANDAMRLNLPSMSSYLPKDFNVDSDLVDTLQPLYQIYCTTMVESVRYMQVDRLFAAFSPSPALLATPVFKLLVDPNLLEWVHTCDSVMYAAMLKMLSRLHLSNVPADVITALQDLTAGFMEKLSVCLNSKFTKAFVEMKLNLARRFVQLLKRLLQCIKTGSRVSRILANAQEKNAMINDWNKIDFPDILQRMVPCAGVNPDILVELLAEKVPQLLERPACSLATCSSFVIGIPAMFPKVSPWLFSLVQSNVLTACLREMSFTSAKSFELWWLMRCWVDEYILWSLELGGFFREEYHRWSYSACAKDMNSEPLPMHDISTNNDAHSNSFVDLLDDVSGDKDWL